MALIRQADARIQARDAIVLDLGDLMRQGDHIKAAAKARAAQIIAEATAERQRILSGAAEEGREIGLRRGRDEGLTSGAADGREAALADLRQKLDALEKSWAAALSEFESRRSQMLREARTDILDLAALIAEKVTKRAVRLDKLAAIDQFEAVLSLLARPTRLRVSVNAEDEPLLRAALPSIVARFSAAEHVELSADPTVARGSCVARTSAGGRMDASIQTQLDRIIEVMMPERSPEAETSGDAS